MAVQSSCTSRVSLRGSVAISRPMLRVVEGVHFEPVSPGLANLAGFLRGLLEGVIARGLKAVILTMVFIRIPSGLSSDVSALR